MIIIIFYNICLVTYYEFHDHNVARPTIPYPANHKAKTRQRILDAAHRLLKRHGYGGVGIDAIMAEAGLTRGGFYAHFASKEALFAEVVAEAVWLAGMAEAGRGSGGARARRAIRAYLSRAHRDNPAEGCPIAALLQDVSLAGPQVRDAFVAAIGRLAAQLARNLTDDGATDAAVVRDKVLATIALSVGGLMLSRAAGDAPLSDEILGACRAAAPRLLDLDEKEPG